ncbi:MAG TPA: hypothetical protein VI432_01910 [Candidatus Paceibacterota bacterium]
MSKQNLILTLVVLGSILLITISSLTTRISTPSASPENIVEALTVNNIKNQIEALQTLLAEGIAFRSYYEPLQEN